MKRLLSYIKTGTTILATAGILMAAVLTSCKEQAKYPDSYGLALYTIRDYMKEDPVRSLHKVADMGYKYVEAAGYNLTEGTFYGFKPAEFKKMVDEAGLELVSSHISVEQLMNENGDFDVEKATKMVDDHAAVGIKYLVSAHIGEKYRATPETYKIIADVCNKLGEMTKAKGYGMLYHNHAFEFDPIGGTDGYSVLLENLDPQLVNFELDCYWAKRADKDPVTLISSHKGRFKALHLKDMANDEEKSFAEIGKGTMDYKAIIQAGFAEGVEYFLVEQDRSKRDAMESAMISCEYLSSINEENQE